LFKEMIYPCTLKDFHGRHYQEGAVHVKRADPAFWADYFAAADVDELLAAQPAGLRYGENLTLSKITAQGARVDMNSNRDGTTGAAQPADVWARFRDDGCSMRILHPQRWSPKLLRMIAALEEYFECLVGCNLYYTPPSSQGFAPHYDDVDVFVLQVAGRKTWHLFPCRTDGEALPIFSSGDFREAELGPPVARLELGPGDLLYLPRGAIHKAATVPGEESMHLTVSANQMHTWAHLLEDALPEALREASQKHVALRATPPLGYPKYMGAVHADDPGAKRQGFLARAEALAALVLEYLTSAGDGGLETPVDHAVDVMNARFQEGRMQPLFGNKGSRRKRKRAEGKPQLAPETELQLRKAGCARLVAVADRAVLYHCFNNSVADHASGAAPREWANDPAADSRLEFEIADAGLLEAVTRAVQPTKVADFPVEAGDEGVREEILQAMLAAGVLERVGSGASKKRA